MTYDISSNSVYLAGSTTDSTGFWATSGCYQDSIPIVFDPNMGYLPHIAAFVVKFNATGQRQWATYYGGTNYDHFNDIWADHNGNVYCLGNIRLFDTTGGPNRYTTPNADEPALLDSVFVSQNTYLVKFDPQGQRQWGTWVGNQAYINNIAGLDNPSGGNPLIYLSGYGPNKPGNATPNSYQPNFAGGSGSNVLLLQYNGDGTKNWGTYFGIGNSSVLPYTKSLSIKDNGNLLLTGLGEIAEMACHPYPSQAHQSFISEWSGAEGQLLWSSYFDSATINTIHAGKGKVFYIGGQTDNDSLATPNTDQPTKPFGAESGFLTAFTNDRFCPILDLPIHQNGFTYSVDSGFGQYQWFNQDGSINGGNGSSIMTNQDSGFLFVSISDSCGCKYLSDTFNFNPTGVRQVEGQSAIIRVYPNPNDGQFSLTAIFSKPVREVSLRITDILGRTVYQKSSVSVRGNQLASGFNLKDKPTGIYILQLIMPDGTESLKIEKRETRTIPIPRNVTLCSGLKYRLQFTHSKSF